MMTKDSNEMTDELAVLTDATRRLCKLHGDLDLTYPKTEGFRARPAHAAARQAPVATQPLPPQAPPSQTQKTAPAVFPTQDVAALKDTIVHCERCVPEAKRPTPLFGKGRQDRPVLLIIGDAASSEGVSQGEIFPDRQGDLLTKMLAAIDISIEDVFLANIIRCALEPSEVALDSQLKNCRPHLLEQINLFRPTLICTMGQMASQTLISTKNKLIALRGRFHQFNNIPLMATYHPSQLLQVPDLKKAAWYDLQLIQHKLKQLAKT